MLGTAAAAQERGDAARLPATIEGAWVELDGTVVSRAGTYFILDYGVGRITVEMDDYERLADNPLVPGDRVRVTGEVDAEVNDTRRTIEASTVCVHRLGRTLYASAADEEAVGKSHPNAPLADKGERVDAIGTVIAAMGDWLLLSTGARITVVGTMVVAGNAKRQLLRAHTLRRMDQDVTGLKPNGYRR